MNNLHQNTPGNIKKWNRIWEKLKAIKSVDEKPELIRPSFFSYNIQSDGSMSYLVFSWEVDPQSILKSIQFLNRELRETTADGTDTGPIHYNQEIEHCVTQNWGVIHDIIETKAPWMRNDDKPLSVLWKKYEFTPDWLTIEWISTFFQRVNFYKQ